MLIRRRVLGVLLMEAIRQQGWNPSSNISSERLYCVFSCLMVDMYRTYFLCLVVSLFGASLFGFCDV